MSSTFAWGSRPLSSPGAEPGGRGHPRSRPPGAPATSSGTRARVARVQRVAEPVAEKVEARHRHGDHHARKDRDPRRRGKVALRIVEHVSPARERRLGARPEEGDGGPEQERPPPPPPPRPRPPPPRGGGKGGGPKPPRPPRPRRAPAHQLPP